MPRFLVPSLCLALAATSQGATSLDILEPTTPELSSAQVPVVFNSSIAAVAMQADVLYDEDLYTVDDVLAGNQPDGVKIESHITEPGCLRVVVYSSKSTAMASEVLFQVPLSAINGGVSNDPVVITNFIVAGQGGGVLDSSIRPRVRLSRLREGQTVFGRRGIELTATAIPGIGEAAIDRVEYYVDGVLVGEGQGNGFFLLWEPETSGPHVVTVKAYDSEGQQASSRDISVVVTHVGTYAGPVLGTYAGLVRGPDFNFDRDGYVSMTSTTKGAFTLKLLTGGKTYAAKGNFGQDGNAEVTVPRKGATPLTVVLAQSSETSVSQIHGRVSDGSFDGVRFNGGTFETEFEVDKLVWNAKTAPAVMSGGYTVLLPASDNAVADGAPRGTGFGTASVSTAGAVKAALSLADGTKATVSSIVSKDGMWPLYASLYKARGVLTGEMEFVHEDEIGDVTGTLNWLRPADPKAAAFKAGYVTETDGVGSLLSKPEPSQRLIPLANLGSNASLFLSDGGLEATTHHLTTYLAANKVLVPLQDALRPTVTANAQTGLLTGNFFHPDTQKAVKFQGIVLQEQQLFGGYFLAGGHGGDVRLAANSALPDGSSSPIGQKPLPVVKITAPKANATLAPATNSQVAVSGTAADKSGITSVTYQILHNGELSAPATATGTTAWSFNVPVAAGDGGLYGVHVKARAGDEDESEVATLQFWMPLKASLVVDAVGPGTVAKFAGTTQQDVGKLITISAKPNAKKRFIGWTGGLVSTSPTITVLMEEGLTLEAHFDD